MLPVQFCWVKSWDSVEVGSRCHKKRSIKKIWIEWKCLWTVHVLVTSVHITLCPTTRRQNYIQTYYSWNSTMNCRNSVSPTLRTACADNLSRVMCVHWPAICWLGSELGTGSPCRLSSWLVLAVKFRKKYGCTCRWNGQRSSGFKRNSQILTTSSCHKSFVPTLGLSCGSKWIAGAQDTDLAVSSALAAVLRGARDSRNIFSHRPCSANVPRWATSGIVLSAGKTSQ